jgi:hypothetical protein
MSGASRAMLTAAAMARRPDLGAVCLPPHLFD